MNIASEAIPDWLKALNQANPPPMPAGPPAPMPVVPQSPGANPMVGAVGDYWRTAKSAMGGDVDEAVIAVSGVPDIRRPQSETDVPPHPGIPGSADAGLDDAEGAEGAMLARRRLFPRMFGPTGMSGAIMPEGENFLPFGGTEGKALWQDTAVTKPQQLEEAVMAGAQAESDLGSAKADFFKRTQESQAQELALIKERQNARQAEIIAKQQQLEQATQRYSNDLADRGQYWRNPGNIISAIGAALIAGGSPNDPGIGVRMINQAVQFDYAQRKGLADMHLGELRSNVAAYRQIAGDKDLGDKLAYAEGQRVASMELERISGQFQGPIAKAKAAAISKEFLRNYSIQMAQIHAAMVYNKPHMENPLVKQSYDAAGKATGGVGYTPFAGPGSQSGAVSGSKSVAGPGQPNAVVGHPGATGGQVSLSPFAARMKTMWKPMSDSERSMYEKRAPGSSRQIEAEYDDVIERIASVSKGNPDTFNSKMEEFERGIETDIKDIAKAAQPSLDKVNGYRRMQQDMGVISNLAKRVGKTESDLLGDGPESITGKGLMKTYEDIMNGLFRDDPANSDKYRREKQETADAVARFKQLLAGNANAYIKSTSGGAVSDSENERLKQYLPGGWRGIQTFHADQSARAQADLRGAINTSSHPISGTLYRIQYGLGTQGLDVKGVDEYDKFGKSTKAVNDKRGTSKTDRDANVTKAIQNLKRK